MSSPFRPLPLLVSVALAWSVPASAKPRPRDQARTLVAEIEKTPAAKSAAKDALAEAQRALVRAERARLAGDHRHGALLEDLALEWAEAARDLSRGADAAARAASLEQKLGDTEAKLESARTLIEQTNGRRARAEAQLKELEATIAPPGVTKPATPPPAAKPKPEAPKGKPAPAAAPSAAPAPAPQAAPTPPPPAAPAPAPKSPTPAPTQSGGAK